MTTPKILVAMDFDNTILSRNTSVDVKSLVADKEIPKDLHALSKVDGQFIVYMRELFKFIAKHDIGQEEYRNWLRTLTLVEGMRELILKMGESKDCEIIIISDANSFFIQDILRNHLLIDCVDRVFTNPAEFDGTGCLQIEKFQDQTTCSRCPENMCKGAVLMNYLSKRMSEGVQFQRTLYVGDGANDVCPALQLGRSDYVFPRIGFRMLRSLEKMPMKSVLPTIVPWETGHDILNAFMNP